MVVKPAQIIYCITKSCREYPKFAFLQALDRYSSAASAAFSPAHPPEMTFLLSLRCAACIFSADAEQCAACNCLSNAPHTCLCIARRDSATAASHPAPLCRTCSRPPRAVRPPQSAQTRSSPSPPRTALKCTSAGVQCTRHVVLSIVESHS